MALPAQPSRGDPEDDLAFRRPPRPVPPDRAAAYVRDGHWDYRTLRDGLESASAARPDGLAVADDRVSLTWAEMEARVTAGVTRLQSLGLSERHAVLLISGNVAEGVVAYHCLLRVGALAVLLDRRCGPSDVRVAMGAAPISVVIASPTRGDLESEFGDAAVVALDDFAEDVPSAEQPSSWAEPDRNHIAVVVFTSGTTDRPKGVTHSLNTLTVGARNMALQMAADASTLAYLVSPLASITGLMQVHMTTDQHAGLVLDDAFDPGKALDRINRSGATFIGDAPVSLSAFSKLPTPARTAISI